MRNRIPDITEVAVIDDFLLGSNDETFARDIMQKAPVTSEQLLRKADQYITADERARDLVDRRRDDRGKDKKHEDTAWQERR